MTTTARIAAGALALAYLLAGTCPAEDEKPQPARGVHVITPAPAAPEGDESPNARVERLLQARVDIVAKKKPLEMVEAIGGAVGVEIEIRPGTAGKWPYQNEAAAWNMRACTAEAVLDLLLLRVSSSWTIHEGRIVVFPRYEEDRWMATETLPIDDLVERKPEWMPETAFVDDLIKCITNTVAPSDSLEDSFRLHRAGSKEATLELTATPGTRRRVGRLLHALQTAVPAKPPVVMHAFYARNKALRVALDKRVTLDADDMRLSAFVDEISRQVGVPINLDVAVLDDTRISDGTPITFSCHAIRASDVLARALHLSWIFHGGTVVVTTGRQADSLLSTVIFDVADLTVGEGKSENVDTLIECLIRTIQPSTWNNFGGKAAISPLRLEGRTFLVVSQDQDALDEIATLLDAMRRVQGEKAKVMTEWHDETATFAKALEKEVTWHFNGTPLENVVVAVAKSLDVPVFLDRQSLEDMGIGTDAPISLPVGTYTARDALRRALCSYELGVLFEHGGLTITTGDRVDTPQFAVYDLSDLVSADNAHEDADSLISGILSSVERTAWDGYGSTFAFSSPKRTTLIISDTQEVLGEIARLLDALRTIARTKAKVLIIESEKEAAVRKALTKRVEWTFKDVSLPEAIKKIAADLKVAVYIDEVSMDDSGIDPEEVPVLLPRTRADAAEALRRALGPHKLDCIIANGALAVVTDEVVGCSWFYETRIYDVTDLVAAGKAEPDGLAAAIRAYIAPRTGRHGTESVEPIALPDGQTVLVIRHERRVQEEIQQQLEALRK